MASATCTSASSSPPPTAEEWFASATRIPLSLPDGRVIHISTHLFPCSSSSSSATSTPPTITFLHGFPTCSHDFAALLSALTPHATLLLWDLWGYGDSDKVAGMEGRKEEGEAKREDFSVFNQADLQEALWRHLGIRETHVVSHDLGDTVLQELAARRQQAEQEGGKEGGREGAARTVIHDVFLFNGGIFPQLHRPVLMQTLLLTPFLGPFLSRYLMSEWSFSKGIRGVFAPSHPPSPSLVRDMWASVGRRDGYRIYHILIKYVSERRENRERWEGGLEWLVKRAAAAGGREGGREGGRVYFWWGGLDPVSGAHVAVELKRRFEPVGMVVIEEGEGKGGREGGRVTLKERGDLGHWLFLEDGEGARRALAWFFGRGSGGGGGGGGGGGKM